MYVYPTNFFFYAFAGFKVLVGPQRFVVTRMRHISLEKIQITGITRTRDREKERKERERKRKR